MWLEGVYKSRRRNPIYSVFTEHLFCIQAVPAAVDAKINKTWFFSYKEFLVYQDYLLLGYRECQERISGRNDIVSCILSVGKFLTHGAEG